MTKAETILGGYIAGAADAGLHFNCYRCGAVLTDPASTEAGIGPECRKLANAALAITIPGNPETAIATLAKITFASGITAETLAAVVEEITAGIESGRADWRGVVNVLVRLIAYGIPAAKPLLCDAVEALGYVTLAAVAREEASPSAAELTVATGRLVLKTKKNMAAVAAMKAISGRKFEPVAKVWTFPVTELRAVCAVVTKFFPTTKLNVLALATEAAAAVKVATELKASAPAAPTVEIVKTANGYNVFSPYNAAFVAELKVTLPYKARAWNGVSKCWTVALDAIEPVKTLIAKHYGAAALAA